MRTKTGLGREKTPTAYRPDIDGLRGVAILAVILFHLIPDKIRGGFVGVDIFFVISGFLITGIITSSLRSNTFSLADFYSRRVIRIVPGLVVMLLTVLILGFFTLYDDEFKNLGKHVGYSSIFANNFALVNESGYFDTSIENKPLAHLWSLAIEEQFYLIWPLLLSFTFSRGLKFLHIIPALLLSSFFLNVGTAHWSPHYFFYALETRGWELLIGALLSHFEVFRYGNLKHPFTLSHRYQTVLKNLVAFCGTILLIVAISAVDNNKAYPGWWALLPTVGTSLLILVGRDAWINRNILSSKFLIFTGLISYPIYLWHWPLLSLLKTLTRGYPRASLTLSTLIFAVGMSWITFRFIERPFRSTKARRFNPTIVLALILGGIGFCGVLVMKIGNGRPSQFVDTGVALEKLADANCLLKTSELDSHDWCMSDKREIPTNVVIGDSRAHAIFSGLLSMSSPHARWMLMARGGCPSLYRVNKVSDPPCGIFNTSVLQKLVANKSIKTVLLAASVIALTNYSVYAQDKELEGRYSGQDLTFEGLSRTIRHLQAAGKTVVLLRDNPHIKDPPKRCIPRPFGIPYDSSKLRCSVSEQKNENDSQEYMRIVTRLKASLPDLRVFDPMKSLCENGICETIRNSKSLYGETDHLSDYGSEVVAKPFLESLGL